ncbi:MAG: ABC transporter substrate-binding protein [Ilumatobacteraceae bacterium]|nr:ABC transporter substrate-binding protein [Ilumatobacteraceae bacterium]
MAFDPVHGLVPGRFNRRQLILGSGTAVAIAAALAACGSDSPSTAPAASGAPSATDAAVTPTDAATTATDAATATTAAATGTPKSGGILRVGTKGDVNDIIDGQHIVAKSDIMRQVTGWEPLMSFSPDFVPEYANGLAKDVTAKAADNFVITLKDGIKFSNGNPVTADDVVYSFTRMLDTTLKVYGGSVLRGLLEVSGITKVDDHTVEFKLTQGVSNFKEALCAYVCAIVPVGYERFSGDPTTQIGTGPYMLKEFEVGKQSIHVKNPNYWDTGKPYFDEVHIIDFADGDALINALLADQIDIAADVSSASVDTITGTTGYKVLNSAGGGWLTISMAVDQDPFTDVRVRQAMRLIVDRDAMVEQVLAGYGRVANDLYAPLDAAYAKDLPQRKQDLDAAKQLLADAGKTGMTIDLFAPNDTAGLPEMIQLFAEQAKGAGITVNAQVIDGGTYWGDQYLKRTFAVDYWGTRNFLLQVAAGSLKDTAPYPDDHWPPADSTFEADYKAALNETDDTKRKVITDKMQKELYDNGGLIIPFFQNLLDAYNGRVTGLVERANTLNLDHYGRGWKNLYFSE